jgi:hypothetical protein
MGNNDRVEHKPQRSKKPQTQARLPWEGERENNGALSWDVVDDEVILNAIVTACAHGGSIQFTASRDRGALGVRVYDDALPTKTVWAEDEDKAVAVLQAIIDHYVPR